KMKELQKKKAEADLTVAPLKAKLACLVRKCHERNSMITQLVRKLHRHGTMDSVLSEQAKDLVNDTVLADYLSTFTPAHDQKVKPYKFPTVQRWGRRVDAEGCEWVWGNCLGGLGPLALQGAVLPHSTWTVSPCRALAPPWRATAAIPHRIPATLQGHNSPPLPAPQPHTGPTSTPCNSIGSGLLRTHCYQPCHGSE
uniref:Uncharacterized protein n=1 Tax=Crocodylus porosus TaxID=8502 RepID=A0A7M4E6H3_CROPO